MIKWCLALCVGGVLALWNSVSVATDVNVLASIRPLQLIAKSVLPGEVDVLLPMGATPHDYSLRPSDLRRIQQADIIIWLGAEFEPYLAALVAKRQAQSTSVEIIDLSTLPSLERLPIRPLMAGHHHEPDDDHDDHHEAIDPHLWWSSHNGLIVAREVVATMNRLSPQTAEPLQKKLRQLEKQLKVTLQHYQKILQETPPVFILFHDGLQYVEHALNISSTARIVVDPSLKPGIKTVLALKKKIAASDVRCVLLEPNTNTALLKKLQTNKPLRSVIVDPMGWDVDDYQMMLKNAYQKLSAC